jgi:hypothetical protein
MTLDLPKIVGTLAPGSHPGGVNGQDAYSGQIIPTTSAAVTAKWAKGTGGPADDECQNLVAVELGRD